MTIPVKWLIIKGLTFLINRCIIIILINIHGGFVVLKELTSTNGLDIDAVYREGRIYIRGECKSRLGNLSIFEIPADYGMLWYPLPFYFDYYYYTNYHSILLHIDKKAPSKIIEDFSNHHHFLHEFYDYKHEKIGSDKSMYFINLSITTKLKSMGLKTWDVPYNLQDVSYNYEILSNSLDKTEKTIIDREKSKGHNPNKVENNPMDFATDKELAYLADLGMGYKMTGYQRKVANTMYKVG